MRVLRGLAQDRAKCTLTYDAPTGTVWQEFGLGAIGERVRHSTFQALVRNGWITERGDWAAFNQAYWVISDAGLREAARDD